MKKSTMDEISATTTTNSAENHESNRPAAVRNEMLQTTNTRAHDASGDQQLLSSSPASISGTTFHAA
jgi:hypothetical protein